LTRNSRVILCNLSTQLSARAREIDEKQWLPSLAEHGSKIPLSECFRLSNTTQDITVQQKIAILGKNTNKSAPCAEGQRLE